MEEEIVTSFTTNLKIFDKDVTINIRYLSEYSEKKFNEDLREIIEVQRGKEIGKGAPYPQNRQYEMRRFPGWNVRLLTKKDQELNFDFFVKTVNNLLPQILVRAIKRVPLLIEKNQLSFTITIVDSDQRGNFEFITHEPDISEWGFAYMNAGGTFLLGRLVFPWFCFGKIDYAVLEKNISDVLELHLVNIRKLYKREYAVQDKIAEIMEESPKIWNKGLVHLYFLFCDLYTNGRSMFVEAENRSKILVDLNAIKSFKDNMTALAKIKDEKKAEEFYTEKLQTREGQYEMALLMCYFIGLNISIKNGRIGFLTAYMPNGQTIDIEIGKLNNSLKKYNKLYLPNLDPLSYKDTYNLLESLNSFRQFIQLYEKSCNELKLDKQSRIIWFSFYKKLRKIALRTFERQQKKI